MLYEKILVYLYCERFHGLVAQKLERRPHKPRVGFARYPGSTNSFANVPWQSILKHRLHYVRTQPFQMGVISVWGRALVTPSFFVSIKLFLTQNICVFYFFCVPLMWGLQDTRGHQVRRTGHLKVLKYC